MLAPISSTNHYQMPFYLSCVYGMKNHVGLTDRLLQIQQNDLEEKQQKTRFIALWQVNSFRPKERLFHNT